MGLAAEVVHDTPHRIQRCLHRAFHPGWGPRHIVASNEDAALLGRHVLLHEVRVHALVVAVVPWQRAFEGAEEVRVGLPGDGDRIADDMPRNIGFRVDLLQSIEGQLHTFSVGCGSIFKASLIHA